MIVLGNQRIDRLFLAAMVVFAAVLAAAVGFMPGLVPWFLAGLALAAAAFYWTGKWDITIISWLWVFSYGFLDWPEWKIQLTGFFNLSVPRMIFLLTIVMFLFYYILHRRAMRFDLGLLWVMLILMVYVGTSAAVTGWTAQTDAVRSAPYYRFLGSIVFPFLIFFMVYNTASAEKNIRHALVLLTIYGWYALYISYLQYAAVNGMGWARNLIWPAYINDPNYGIHYDRARGAFAGASPQAILMIMLFYTDLYLIRKIKGPYRFLLILQAVLVPPAVFFTLLRSAYLAFILCGLVWLFFAARRLRKLKLATFIVLIAIGVFVSWNRLSSTDRRSGGVAQTSPIHFRIVLLRQTWEMVKERPVVGVGFGKFVDTQMSMPREPSSLAGATSGVLVQHNLFLNMLAETGVLGLFLTILVFILVFRQSLQLYRKLPPDEGKDVCRDFVVLFWVLMVNYLTDAMFRDPLWEVFSNGLLWYFAALVVYFNRTYQRTAPEPVADLPVEG